MRFHYFHINETVDGREAPSKNKIEGVLKVMLMIGICQMEHQSLGRPSPLSMFAMDLNKIAEFT